jgi:hypothetical protein
MDLDREDLVAFVDRLQHEHFSYDERGARAARALKALEGLVADGGILIVDPPPLDGTSTPAEALVIPAPAEPAVLAAAELLDDEIPF